jgi:hypothetical protein
MIGALLYLRFTSLRNLVIFRLGRLRQPKYLVGTAVAVIYIYFVLLRRTGIPGGPSGAAPGVAEAMQGAVVVICVAASALALARIAFAWIAPAEKPGLRFSEAEIAFLFPAPITRRTLIHFRLLSAQIAILFTSVLLVFFFRRFGGAGGTRLTHAVGWWVILSTFDLHLNGTNLTLSRLKEKGSHYALWRTAAVAAIAAYAIAIACSAMAFLNAHSPGVLASGHGLGRLVQGLADSSPLRWLILPFKVVFAPYFAATALDFGLAMIPALGLLALHYYWVSSTEARFEEGSIALAEKRAAAKAALAGGTLRVDASKLRARSGPFPLSPKGPPETAFLWKNLLSMRSSLLNRRVALLSLWVIFCLCFALKSLLAVRAREDGADVYGLLIVMFCGIVAVYTLLMGPQVVRQDLRGDLPNVDILKTYPIEGWRLALGELLAPVVVLSLVLWLCIIVCAFAIDSRGEVEWLTPGVRLMLALCLGSAAPLLCLIQLIIPNSFMVLLPGWYQASRSRGAGIELMGQRLILGVGQLLIALLAVVPAAGAAALIAISSAWVLGAGTAIALATLAALAILAGEAAVGLWWLGERFAKLDLSREIL